MTGRRIVTVTSPHFSAGAAEPLRDASIDVRLAPKLGARSPEEVIELMRGAVGAIASTDPFDATVLAAAPELRVIARVGVGTDAIDLDAAADHGVVVTVTPGANDAAVAEHAVALMLALVRRVCEQDAAVRRGEWPRSGDHVPGSLRGATVGLVGLGRIGRRTAGLLEAFGARVLGADPAVAPASAGVALVALDELLARSDIVSLHVPLLPATAGLLGAAEIARMRPGALVVNTARGGLIDEDALLAALRSGRLGGAALDVFAAEPPAGSPLLALPNVVATPHVAGLSPASVEEMTRRAAASVLDVLAGRRPPDVANPAVFDHPRHEGGEG